ncbi:hypothetical protein EJ08DRAFT_730544 [Tothia fuscella]|uniref:PNPLA domain-containing protein n=1 Tax=Tothia fuscella TaxID=1048955 RepID=A0A9P4NYN6_9PEZI|nr:hypothetical protein EJ08DRAFT_730544 [Tothia fuscella]
MTTTTVTAYPLSSLSAPTNAPQPAPIQTPASRGQSSNASATIGLASAAIVSSNVAAQSHSKRWLSDRQMIIIGLIFSILSTIGAFIALAPSFQSEKLGERQTSLAEWLALKDYRDFCQTLVEFGKSSLKCNQTLLMELPPPPGIDVPGTQLVRRDELFQEGPNQFAQRESPLALLSYFVLWALMVLICSAPIALAWWWVSPRAIKMNFPRPQTYLNRGMQEAVAGPESRRQRTETEGATSGSKQQEQSDTGLRRRTRNLTPGEVSCEESSGRRILNLSGSGGLHILSTLSILKHLMEAIDANSPPRPCELFHMICGTGDSILVALMLGRLGMSVDECIEIYSKFLVQANDGIEWEIEDLQKCVDEVLDYQALPNVSPYTEHSRYWSPDCPCPKKVDLSEFRELFLPRSSVKRIAFYTTDFGRDQYNLVADELAPDCLGCKAKRQWGWLDKSGFHAWTDASFTVELRGNACDFNSFDWLDTHVKTFSFRTTDQPSPTKSSAVNDTWTYLDQEETKDQVRAFVHAETRDIVQYSVGPASRRNKRGGLLGYLI